MAIIGISGKIGSGKDTIGKIIQFLTDKSKLSLEEGLGLIEYNSTWEIKKYAGKLKQIVSILTGIPVEDLERQEVKDRVLGEEWKRSYYIGTLQSKVILEAVVTEDNIYKTETLTVRQLLQELGTNAMRDVIHPNIWVNALFADYKPNGSPYNNLGDLYDDLKHCSSETKLPNWIITDCRFPNELQAVKDRGGITIRVNRIQAYMENKANAMREGNYNIHRSEIALDNAEFDYTIDNNATIDDLIIKVKDILIKENILNGNTL